MLQSPRGKNNNFIKLIFSFKAPRQQQKDIKYETETSVQKPLEYAGALEKKKSLSNFSRDGAKLDVHRHGPSLCQTRQMI